MTNLKFSIILILGFCFSTSVLATLSNSDFCDTASNPGTSALDPNFVKKTSDQN